MTRVLVALLALLAAGGAGIVWWRTGEKLPAAYDAGPATGKYQCSMHPEIVSEKPGRCPICGMTLTRVDDKPAPAASAAADDVPGRAPFSLSPARQQLIGVRRAAVEVRALRIAIRAAGTVAYDPDLFQAIVEYRQALRARDDLAASTLPEARAGIEGLVRAAAVKLRQKGVSESQLAAVGRREADPVNLLLPGKSVWVYARVYEHELGLVRPGQRMTITAGSLPGRTFTARVASIDPILDPATRTARVRGLVATPHAELRPESFVDVVIDVSLGERLAVPADAVLDTGVRQIVFVVRGAGEFEPRAVRLGREAQGWWEVLAGLAPGEQVVVAANFLIDSESRFKAALRAFATSPPAAGHRH